MKQIEVNTHSDRVELETEIASNVIDRINDMSILPYLTYYEENEDCVKYTELGQFIFNDIVDVISNYIKVKEGEIEYNLNDDFVEYTKEEFIELIKQGLVFNDDSYILSGGSEIANLDLRYVQSLEFDKIKHYLK